jgi:DNA-binding CsgD family transcriptional regulator
MLEATRTAVWVELAADLVSERSEQWQVARINRQLVETFRAVGSMFCDRTACGSLVQDLWPIEPFAGHVDEIYRWSVRNAPAEHPILRYFLETGDWRVIQVADVPTKVVSTDLYGRWIERGRHWGEVQHQVAMPLPTTWHGRRAFVVGRPEPFTAAEMDIARQLQRLLAALDRHRNAFSRRPPASAPTTSGTADCIGLTPREQAVLALLAEGLTAASIGRRLLITERTVHKHLQNSYTKLGVADRLGAVLRAQRIGLLPAS